MPSERWDFVVAGSGAGGAAASGISCASSRRMIWGRRFSGSTKPRTPVSMPRAEKHSPLRAYSMDPESAIGMPFGFSMGAQASG